MKKGRNFWDTMIRQSSVAAPELSGHPIVEIAGNRRVLIEGHCGVLAYSREQILVKVEFGYAQVSGCCLEMIHMTKDNLVILGTIESVHLKKGR